MMRAVALASLALAGAVALAQGMTRDEFKAHQARIQAEYVAAKARCKALQANERDQCSVRALGTRHIARAELDLQFTPGAARAEKVSLARAEAAYSLAKERCDELRGHPKEICRKDAKAALAAARADAKSVRAAADSGRSSRETQRERFAAARSEQDSLYGAGRERCDALGGQARDLCIADLRKRFGRP